MWIFCGGMMRSGSTLQYQITAQLVEEAGLGKRLDWAEPEDFPQVKEKFGNDDSWKVFKAHICTASMIEEFNHGNAMGVYIYRDIRDAFTSHMSKTSVDAQSTFRQGFVENCLKNYEKWTDLPRVLVSQYESTMTDMVAEIVRIAQHLGINLSSVRADQIADELSLIKQKTRLQAMQSFETVGKHKVDSHSLLHSNHIHSGKVGRWQAELTYEEINQIEKKAGSWLVAHGYELSAKPSSAFEKIAKSLNIKS